MRPPAFVLIVAALILAGCASILPSPTEQVLNRGQSAIYIGMYRTGFESFFDEKTEVARLTFQQIGAPSSFLGLEQFDIDTLGPNRPGFAVLKPGWYQLIGIEFGPGGSLNQRASFEIGRHPGLSFSVGPGEVIFLGSFEVFVKPGTTVMELRNKSPSHTDYDFINVKIPGLYNRIQYDPLRPERLYALDIQRVR